MPGPITPSQIATAHECLHFYYLECFGDRSKLREVSEADALRMKKGLLYENEVVSKIEGLEKASWKYPDFKTGYVQTMELLKKGPSWIYSSVLLSRNLLGIPDLLKRIDRRSKLGNYSYEPIDVKNHKKLQSSDIRQLYSYAYLLEPLLGYRPERGGIWLNTGDIEDVIFDKETGAEFSQVLDQMKDIEERKLKTSPVRCSACDKCLWINDCTEVWLEKDHTSLLPKVGKNLCGKLESIGISTCRQVSDSSPEDLSNKLKLKFESACSLVGAAKARKDNKPYVLKEPKFPKDMPVYFYDIETYGETTILHGVIRIDNGKREEKSFYAESLESEKEAWHKFLDYISQDKKAVVYCWTMFEERHMKSLWAKHGGNKAGYKLLEKNLTDQRAFVRDHFGLPCRGYSLKQVAPCFGFHWQAEDAGGGNCEVWYGRWLETKDKDLYTKIIEYNLDDVRAMEVIFNELKDFHAYTRPR